MAEQWGLVETYCVDCHNSIDRTGGLVLEEMSPENVGADAAVWEKVLRKFRGNLMPPPDRPQPSPEQKAAFVAALEHRLAEEAEASGPHPGFVGLRRLNRTEYENAVRDLLGVDVDATELLPPDNKKSGFDNNASVLTISPTFMEQYVAAARTVAIEAVGNPDAPPGSTTYVNDGDAGSYKRHIEGLPLGTRGGLAVMHDFPADGEYVINVADMAQALWVYNMEFENTVLVTLDGREVYRTTIGGEEDQKAIDQHGQSAVDRINQRLKNIRFEATAGPHQVGVTFLARTFAESDDRLQLAAPGGGQDRILRVSSFELQGPFHPSGVSETPSRRKIFSCHVGPDAGAETAESCAREILGRLARLAYRRPVGKHDLDKLLAFYRGGAASGGFETGIRKAVTAILASPDFLFRFASPSEDLPPGSIYELSDLELASRLSFFLWSSIPDDELLRVAEQGRLGEPEVLDAQIERMLADERARSLVTSFAFQWLDVDKLDDVVPDRGIFPQATPDPREAYKHELELFLASILLEDRSVLDLMTADHTFVNETIAHLYGLPAVRGDQFRRVELESSARFGLLGKGAILMATSYPNRTAPVIRGKWILENLIGSPPSPPPPGVDTDLVEDTGPEPRTVRERLEQHRADAVCASCHAVMDPLGLTLENFDAIGEWQDYDKRAREPIDASGKLIGGKEIVGPDELRRALLEDPERIVWTITEELMTYALGRSLEYYDMPTVRRIVDDAARDRYRFSALVRGIVKSDAFRMLEVPPAAETVADEAGEPERSAI
ncbi:MAG TPA: DUF1592 domain-containing protein [Gammaproteobacteria bacterium]